MVDLDVQQIIVYHYNDHLPCRLGFFKASRFALLWGNKCFVSGCVLNFLKALLIVTLIQVCWSTSWCRVIRRQRGFCISMRRCTIVWCMGEAHAWGLGHPINWGVCRQRIISCISDNSCLATNISKCTARESIYRLCFIPQRRRSFFAVHFLLLHHVQNLWSSQYKKSAPLWYYSKKLYFRHYKIPQRRRLLLGLRSQPTLLPLHWGRTTKTTTLGGASSGAPVKVLTRLEIGTLLGLEHISCECQS